MKRRKTVPLRVSPRSVEAARSVAERFDGVYPWEVIEAATVLFAQLFEDEVLPPPRITRFDQRFGLSKTDFCELAGVSKNLFDRVIQQERYSEFGILQFGNGLLISPEAAWNCAHELFTLGFLTRAQATMLLYRVQQMFVIKRAWENITLTLPSVGRTQWKKLGETGQES